MYDFRTINVGESKIQIPVKNTFELFDFFDHNLKVNPKLITLSINGLDVSPSVGQELNKEDVINLGVLDSKIRQ